MLTGDWYAHPVEGSWSGREVADKDRERLTLLTATQESDHERFTIGESLVVLWTRAQHSSLK